MSLRLPAVLRFEIRETARLGVPLALGELAWMSTYIVDALMLGRLPHSALAISASSLGNTIFYTIAFCAIRLLTGLDTLVAQSSGRGDHYAARRMLMQSLWIALMSAPMVMLLTLAAAHALPIFRTPPEIVSATVTYLHSLIWSALPLLLYWVFRQYLQATGRSVLIMVSLITAGAVNFLGDWAFMYGHLGARPHGIAGSGWSTLMVRGWMLLVVLAPVVLRLRTRGPLQPASWRPDLAMIGAQLRIGWPASIQNITDLGFSSYMSIVCARLGATMLAGHQVALDLDAFIYQVPAGISYATITRVGQAAGQASLIRVQTATRASLMLCIGYVIVIATFFAAFASFWAGLYTNDPLVVRVAAPVFVIGALIQLGDALTVVLGSAMTGLADTRTPLLINTGWYWLAGMPLAWWFALRTHLALRGLWMGRAVAALGTGVTLLWLWRRRIRRMQISSSRQRPASAGWSSGPPDSDGSLSPAGPACKTVHLAPDSQHSC